MFAGIIQNVFLSIMKFAILYPTNDRLHSNPTARCTFAGKVIIYLLNQEFIQYYSILYLTVFYLNDLYIYALL